MLEPWHLPLLLATGLAAGFVDAIAGGGGLITVPVLMSLGLGPKEALGTNKLQATFGSGSAAWHYTSAGAVGRRECARGFLFSVLGAGLGALTVQQLDPSFLRRSIPLLLLAVGLYVLFKPNLGARDLRPRMSQPWFEATIGAGIGFYDGFFGPGTGTFWAMTSVLILGFNLVRATAYTKVMNFASNISSLVLFLLGGKVLFLAGVTMGLGQLLGARLGAGMVLRQGTAFIRPVFISVVFALSLKLFWGAYWRH